MLAQCSWLVLLIPLTALVVEDFRSRTVSLAWLVIWAVCCISISLYVDGLRVVVANTALNALLLVYLGAGVAVYVRIRRGRWVNPLKDYAGAGDVVFLAALTPLFDFRGYVMFVIGAAVFSLLWAAVAKAAGCARPYTIPFVGTAGIALGAVLITRALI